MNRYYHLKLRQTWAILTEKTFPAAEIGQVNLHFKNVFQEMRLER